MRTVLMTSLAIGLASVLVSCGPGETRQFDILILGGTVIDGTGDAGREASVGIVGDRIVYVGSPRGAVAPDTIDATGLVVAPGFIDVHSHTPPALIDPDRRLNEGVIRQGVTTVVGGPDGSLSPGQIRQLDSAVARHGAGTNVAFYVGHNAIRREVMDRKRGVPSDDELAKMKGLVREGMEMGAVGFSTGLMYPPGMFSKTDEVVALAAEAEPFNGIYTSHVRNPAFELVESDREAIEIGRRAGVPVKITHLKTVGLHQTGKNEQVIALINEARGRGENVVSDQYPYDGAATSRLTDLIVIPEAMGNAASFNYQRALRTPAMRARLKGPSENGIDGGFAWLKATGYSSMRITSSRDYPELVGKYLSQIAEERNLDPFDAISDLIVNAEHAVGITLGAIQEEDVRQLMVQPWNMIASDGGYSDGKTPVGHPRSTGTFPRLLGHYARDEGVLPLEDAVRKISGFPAEFLGLNDRGRIAEGMAADIVVFDPARIIDRSTWDDPHLFAVGVEHVLVNGVPVLRGAKLTNEAPGTLLKRQR